MVRAFSNLKLKSPNQWCEVERRNFVGPQIWELVTDETLNSTLNRAKKRVWALLIQVYHTFLGNTKAETTKKTLKEFFLLKNVYPENLDAISDGGGERFHQNILCKALQWKMISSVACRILLVDLPGNSNWSNVEEENNKITWIFKF